VSRRLPRRRGHQGHRPLGAALWSSLAASGLALERTRLLSSAGVKVIVPGAGWREGSYCEGARLDDVEIEATYIFVASSFDDLAGRFLASAPLRGGLAWAVQALHDGRNPPWSPSTPALRPLKATHRPCLTTGYAATRSLDHVAALPLRGTPPPHPHG